MPARISTALAEARGTDKRHPRPDELAHPEGLGRPPRHLTKQQVAMWKELVAESVPGVLTRADRKLVEQLAVLYAAFREAQQTGDALPTGAHTQIMRLLGRLGMTPTERVRVPRTAPQGSNPFDDF
jgi:hypothetical protein